MPHIRIGVAASLLLSTLLLLGCATRYTPSTLHPAGEPARQIADLGWFTIVLGVVVYVVYMGFFLYAVFHRRRHGEPGSLPGTPVTWVIVAGFVVPVVIQAVLYVSTLQTLDRITQPPVAPALRIEVIGHRWWWEVRYPGFTTANEIHVPVGQPVELVVTSRDVIHSFWVPQLTRKMDLNPGQFNELWLQADEVGVYWGECAEFCGIQHTQMNFLVIAEPAEQFAAWVENQRQPAVEPASQLAQRGQEVFLGAPCAECHTIRGTSADGTVGPDLTHLASRRTLGAATVEFNKGNLGGWIINSQDIKPGNYMPPFRMPADDLQDLLSYLMSLE